VVSGTLTCPTCGADNQSSSRFCGACGTALPTTASVSVPGEVRKVVTVLFSDVSGSTALGHELDPESLRRLMSRYFGRMESVLERHGGTVEKFIGDAVVAIFGIPLSHEDDALRAVRAAVEMRAVLDDLNEEFRQAWGVALETRTGVNTGEVIAGDLGRGHSFAVGDAVNVAARLEQAAQPGEILIGESTYRLVPDAVVAEPVEPLTVKGKPSPVLARRLLEVILGARGWSRRLDSPLVGRENELERLQDAFAQAVAARACRAVTVLGPAGVGKSRLSEEVITRLEGRARVLRGRCLPYGEGITFWPIVELLRDAAGIREGESPAEARERLDGVLVDLNDTGLVAERLAALLGLAEAAPAIQQTFWAVRKLLELLAAREPLIVVFDDIQWGEPTFLDLVEYLVDWTRGHSVILLCLARPELLEARSGWMTGKLNATVLSLQPLTDVEIERLIVNLVGEARLVKDARARIVRMAEGYPLFVEETLRMLVDDGLLRLEDGRWLAAGDLSSISIPPTIQTLLAARFDRLEAGERAVLERASVVGRVFWWEAVSELSPHDLRSQLSSHLQSLTRKELIHPSFSGEEDALEFTHILVRDAAYREIPKALRAELHERLADWIDARSSDWAGEYDEIVAYHLEQAYRSRRELGLMTVEIEAVGMRAAAYLGSAGRRAIARDDLPAGVDLLSKAASLPSPDEQNRLDLLLQLAFALRNVGDFERLQAVVDEMREAAGAADDDRLLAHVSILELWIRLFTNPEGSPEEARRQAPHAISVFEQLGDEQGLAEAWSLLGLVAVTEAQFGPAQEAWEQAAAHAHAAGERREELEALSWVLLCMWAGPAHAQEGLRRCAEILEQARGDHKGMASAQFMRAMFEATLGRFEDARALIAQARALLQEVGLTVWMAGPMTQMVGFVELLADDPTTAERTLRWGYQTLRSVGEMAWLSTLVAILAEAVYAQGRYDEAEDLAKVSRDSAGSEDAYSQVLWRGVQAKVLARRGSSEEAERLVRASVALAESTDSLELQAAALANLAEVLGLAGRASEADAIVARAVQLFERKGNVVAPQRIRGLVDGLRP
jgi:predicted ATPase/class 3 adenylate cyclase